MSSALSRTDLLHRDKAIESGFDDYCLEPTDLSFRDRVAKASEWPLLYSEPGCPVLSK